MTNGIEKRFGDRAGTISLHGLRTVFEGKHMMLVISFYS